MRTWVCVCNRCEEEFELDEEELEDGEAWCPACDDVRPFEVLEEAGD
jgi:formylmethanofuran dehydrogenase subunit E